MTFGTACNVFLAQNGQPAQPQGSPLGSMLWLAPVFLIMIVFMWMSSRSQKKKEQERQRMLDNVKTKDRVVTIGGIHGRVVSARGNRFVLRVDDEKDVKITVSRTGVSRKADDQPAEGQAP